MSPYEIQKIKEGEYTSAVKSIIQEEKPFNNIVRLLANCPHALAQYLKLFATDPKTSTAQKQIAAHLFVETQLGIISSEKSGLAENSKELTEFIEANKSYLDGDTVIKLHQHYGKINNLSKIARMFGKYEIAIEYEYKGELHSYKYVPVEKQRQALLTKTNQKKYETLKSKMDLLIHSSEIVPDNFDASFDVLVNLIAQIPNLKANEDLSELEHFLQLKTNSPKPIQITLSLLFQLMKENIITARGKYDEIINGFTKKYYNKIDFDLIASYFIANQKYDIASKLYSHVNNRHLLSIRYMMEQIFSPNTVSKSIEPLKTLFKGHLSKAEDHKECFLLILKRAHQLGNKLNSSHWNALISMAHDSKLALDDIFPLMPDNIPIEELHTDISKAVCNSSQSIQESEKIREEIKKRMQQQHQILAESTTEVIECDPQKTKCIFCDQRVCDAPFNVYPCGHAAHIHCFLENISYYFIDDDTNINILSNESILRELPKSCPACGLISLKVLKKKFLENDDKEDIEKWDVPF